VDVGARGRPAGAPPADDRRFRRPATARGTRGRARQTALQQRRVTMAAVGWRSSRGGTAQPARANGCRAVPRRTRPAEAPHSARCAAGGAQPAVADPPAKQGAGPAEADGAAADADRCGCDDERERRAEARQAGARVGVQGGAVQGSADQDGDHAGCPSAGRKGAARQGGAAGAGAPDRPGDHDRQHHGNRACADHRCPRASGGDRWAEAASAGPGRHRQHGHQQRRGAGDQAPAAVGRSGACRSRRRCHRRLPAAHVDGGDASAGRVYGRAGWTTWKRRCGARRPRSTRTRASRWPSRAWSSRSASVRGPARRRRRLANMRLIRTARAKLVAAAAGPVSEIDELKALLQQTVQAKQTEQASMSLEVEELKRKMEVPHATLARGGCTSRRCLPFYLAVFGRTSPDAPTRPRGRAPVGHQAAAHADGRHAGAVRGPYQRQGQGRSGPAAGAAGEPVSAGAAAQTSSVRQPRSHRWGLIRRMGLHVCAWGLSRPRLPSRAAP